MVSVCVCKDKILMLDFDECPKFSEGVFTVPVMIPVLHFGGKV